MYKQLSLFPELTTKVVGNLDEEVEKYIKDIPLNLKDLLKKYIDLHES